jgi:hypothetical protein
VSLNQRLTAVFMTLLPDPRQPEPAAEAADGLWRT